MKPRRRRTVAEITETVTLIIIALAAATIALSLAWICVQLLHALT